MTVLQRARDLLEQIRGAAGNLQGNGRRLERAIAAELARSEELEAP